MSFSYQQTTSLCTEHERVGLRQKLSYSLLVTPIYLLVAPLVVIHGIYAKYFGLSLSAIATVLLICRLFDAVSDPLVGYCSDRHNARIGSRKPFVIVGALLLVAGSYFLFMPNENNVNALYFLVCMLVWYFAFTVFEIPHLSWATELMADSHGKTTLYGLRSLGGNIGLLLFYLIPFLPVFASRSYTPQMLIWVYLTAAVFVFPALWLCCRLTPDGYQAAAIAIERNSQQPSLWSLRREIINNKPLLIFLAAFVSYGIGTGMWFSLQFIYIDIYLKLGDHFALVNLIGLCVSSVLIPFWINLSRTIGKKHVWCVGLFLYILGIVLASRLLPGETNLSFLVWVMILNYTSISAINILVMSLLADIIDYGRYKFSTDHTAIYFSLLTFSIKSTAAMGGAFSLGIAGWYGFDPSMISHTSEQIFGLRLAAFGLPIPLLLITLIFVVLIPMNSHRHKIIRRRLDGRAVLASQPVDQISPNSSVLSKDAALSS